MLGFLFPVGQGRKPCAARHHVARSLPDSQPCDQGAAMRGGDGDERRDMREAVGAQVRAADESTHAVCNERDARRPACGTDRVDPMCQRFRHCIDGTYGWLDRGDVRIDACRGEKTREAPPRAPVQQVSMHEQDRGIGARSGARNGVARPEPPEGREHREGHDMRDELPQHGGDAREYGGPLRRRNRDRVRKRDGVGERDGHCAHGEDRAGAPAQQGRRVGAPGCHGESCDRARSADHDQRDDECAGEHLDTCRRAGYATAGAGRPVSSRASRLALRAASA
jgi:hypothetical protein